MYIQNKAAPLPIHEADLEGSQSEPLVVTLSHGATNCGEAAARPPGKDDHLALYY